MARNASDCHERWPASSPNALEASFRTDTKQTVTDMAAPEMIESQTATVSKEVLESS